MKKILIPLVLFLAPSFMFASPSGMSASATMTSRLTVFSAMSVVENTDMRFPTMVDGMAVNNVTTEMPSFVAGGLAGQDAAFTVTGEPNSVYSIHAPDHLYVTNGPSTLEYGLWMVSGNVSGRIISGAGTDPFGFKGDFSSYNTGKTVIVGVYTGTSVITVVYNP